MHNAQQLLILLLLVATPFIVWPPDAPRVGAAGRPEPCPVRVEAAGAGVGCLLLDEARRAGLRPGDRLSERDGRLLRGRMAGARLAAWSLAVDLNHASLEELASLDGVGGKLAERIAAARPFRSVDDVRRVKGIGDKRLARIRDRLAVLDE